MKTMYMLLTMMTLVVMTGCANYGKTVPLYVTDVEKVGSTTVVYGIDQETEQAMKVVVGGRQNLFPGAHTSIRVVQDKLSIDLPLMHKTAMVKEITYEQGKVTNIVSSSEESSVIEVTTDDKEPVVLVFKIEGLVSEGGLDSNVYTRFDPKADKARYLTIAESEYRVIEEM